MVMVPLLVVLFFFGKRIRAKSHFAPALDIEQDKRKEEESTEAFSSTGDDQ